PPVAIPVVSPARISPPVARLVTTPIPSAVAPVHIEPVMSTPAVASAPIAIRQVPKVAPKNPEAIDRSVPAWLYPAAAVLVVVCIAIGVVVFSKLGKNRKSDDASATIIETGDE